MEKTFDITLIVNYLEKFKLDLHKLYSWNAKIDKLIDLGIFTKEKVLELNSLTPYEKEIELKKVVGGKLREYLETDKSSFEKLCLWIIKDWGGITSANDRETINLVYSFLNDEKKSFKRIASKSKVGAYLYPEQNVIYDSRVAYSINWIILKENAGDIFFPIPEGRNSKMIAFDMDVLIRLKNIHHFQPKSRIQTEERFFIKNADKKIFIKESEAYIELTTLIKRISDELWKGDDEKKRNLYYTEMLLFSIADREIFMDITNTVKFEMNI